MATKGKKGFSLPSWVGSHVSLLSDTSIRIDQTARRRAAKAAGEHPSVAQTGVDFVIRELGLARTSHGVGGHFNRTTKWNIYAHSQVSDNPWRDTYPASVLQLNRDDLEWLVTAILRELTSEEGAS